MQQLRNIYDSASGFLDGARTSVRTLLEVIRHLQYQKLSRLFYELRTQLEVIIQSGQIHVYEQQFQLSGHFKDYFSNGVEGFIIDELEPIIILRIKKIHGILQRFEHIFNQIEHLNTGASDPDSTIDKLRIFHPAVLASLHVLLNDIHALFHEIFAFGLDADTLFNETSLHFLWVQLFKMVHAEEKQQRLLTSLATFSTAMGASYQRQMQAMNPHILAQQTGNILGHLMYMMSAGDEKFQFLSHLLCDVPSILQSLQRLIQEQLGVADLQTTMHELNVLKDRTQEALKGIGFWNDLSLKSALNVISMITHLRSMLRLLQHYSTSIGHIHLDLQQSIKGKLHQLKFDYLLHLFIGMDQLEHDFMLAPGQLTAKTMPIVEEWYASLVTFLASKVSFTSTDESLVNLMDTKWHELRLDASYQRKILLASNQQRLERLSHDLRRRSDLAGLKQRFYALKDYFIKADEAWFNHTLQSLQAEQRPPNVSPQTLEKLQILLEQGKNSLAFQTKRLDTSHEYLLDLQHQFLCYLRLPSAPDLPTLRTRLWFQCALIHDGQQFYFYHGQDQTLQVLPQFRQPLLLSPGNYQLQRLSPREFVSLPELMRPMLSHSRWFIHHLRSESLLGDSIRPVTAEMSVDELSLLNEDYQSKLLKLKLAKKLIIELHDFILALRDPSGNGCLSPENMALLLLKFFQAGPWLHEAAVEFCALLVHPHVEIARLKRWVALKVLLLIDFYQQRLQAYQQQLMVVADALMVHEQRQNALGFSQLQILPRSDFLVRSTRYSTFFQSLQVKLENIKPYYALAMRQRLHSPMGYYQDLLKAPVFLAQAQQTLEYQLLFNALHYLSSFASEVESLKVSDLEPSYSSVGVKIDITVSYLNMQAYFVPGGLAWQYHQRVLTHALQNLQHLLRHPITELRRYELYDDVERSSGLEQGLHWILNGDEIFKDMVAPHTLERDFNARLQQQTHATMAKIKTILQTSNYWWLLTETFNILSFMREIKHRFNRLIAEIYRVNHQNLPRMRQIIFAELIDIADQLELDLGLNPQLFSQALLDITNLIFAHYLRAMRPDPLIWATILCDDGLERYRLNQLLVRQAQTQETLAQRQLQTQKFTSFIHDFEPYRHRITHLPPNLKTFFLTHIYPVIQELFPHYTFALPPAFLSESQHQLDALFQAWVNTSSIPIIAHDYENLIHHTKAYLQGRINSLLLEQDLLNEKKVFLDASLRSKSDDLSTKLKLICQDFYQDSLQQIEAQRKIHFHHLGEAYFTCFHEKLAVTEEELAQWSENLIVLMQAPWVFDAHAAISQGQMQAKIDAVISAKLKDFDQKHTQLYLVLDGMVAVIQRYKAYLHNNPRHLEALELIPEKLKLLSFMQACCLDTETPIEQRFRLIQAIIQDQNFMREMRDFGREQHNRLSAFILSCWQAVLNLVSHLGVFCQAQQPMIYLRKMDKLTRLPPVSTLSMYMPSSLPQQKSFVLRASTQRS